LAANFSLSWEMDMATGVLFKAFSWVPLVAGAACSIIRFPSTNF
jgi:hypothetical protein